VIGISILTLVIFASAFICILKQEEGKSLAPLQAE